MQEAKDLESFAWIYNLYPHVPLEGKPFNEYVASNPSAIPDCSQLLFLSGYPSPRILAELGWRYEIDPEYFDRHLMFLKSNKRRGEKGLGQSEETSSIIPSLQRNILQTAIVSIGVQDKSYESTTSKRLSYATKMGAYYHRLTMGEGWKP